MLFSVQQAFHIKYASEVGRISIMYTGKEGSDQVTYFYCLLR